MFLTVFAASALAHILFTNPSEKVDLSDIKTSLRHLDDGLNQITNTMDRHHTEVVNQLASISDTTAFLKARMCLQDFNPKLLGNPNIGPDCNTVEAIMAAATEGFNLLMEVAVASDNGYPEAQKRFDETYGNYTWVADHFGHELNAYQRYLERKNDMQIWIEQRNQKVNEIIKRTKSLWDELITYTQRLYTAVERWEYYQKRFLLKWKCKKIYTEITQLQAEIRKCLLACGRDIIYIPEHQSLIWLTKCTDIEAIYAYRPDWLNNLNYFDFWCSDHKARYSLGGKLVTAQEGRNVILKKARTDTMQLLIPIPHLPIDSNWKTYNWVESCNLSKAYPRVHKSIASKQASKQALCGELS